MLLKCHRQSGLSSQFFQPSSNFSIWIWSRLNRSCTEWLTISRHSTIVSIPNAGRPHWRFWSISPTWTCIAKFFPRSGLFRGADRYATLKFSPEGNSKFPLEPWSEPYRIIPYAVFKSNRKTGSLPWTCSTADRNMAEGLRGTQAANAGITPGLAGILNDASCSILPLQNIQIILVLPAAQVNLVLVGINATLTRCNGVKEKTRPAPQLDFKYYKCYIL